MGHHTGRHPGTPTKRLSIVFLLVTFIVSCFNHHFYFPALWTSREKGRLPSPPPPPSTCLRSFPMEGSALLALLDGFL